MTGIANIDVIVVRFDQRRKMTGQTTGRDACKLLTCFVALATVALAAIFTQGLVCAQIMLATVFTFALFQCFVELFEQRYIELFIITHWIPLVFFDHAQTADNVQNGNRRRNCRPFLKFCTQPSLGCALCQFAAIATAALGRIKCLVGAGKQRIRIVADNELGDAK